MYRIANMSLARTGDHFPSVRKHAPWWMGNTGEIQASKLNPECLLHNGRAVLAYAVMPHARCHAQVVDVGISENAKTAKHS